MLFIFHSPKFKKSVIKIIQSRKVTRDEIDIVVQALAEERKLDQRHQDHSLKGNLSDLRECHIKNDILLMYQIRKKELILVVADIGTHGQLFG